MDTDMKINVTRLTSIEMPVTDHVGYSSKLAELCNKDLGVDTERVIVEFHSPEPTNVGWSGSTIAEMRKNSIKFLQ